MLKEKPRILSEIVVDVDSRVYKLAAEARRRVHLTDYLRNELPEGLSAGVLGCNIRPDGTLVVIASSPEWANRLRFESARLLQIGQALESQVQSIKLRVANSVTG